MTHFPRSAWHLYMLRYQKERLCQEAVWFTQPMLLGPPSDMDEIAVAIRKIHAHAGELAQA